MKNSAWYHQLWRKKADEFPLKEDAHASWQEMQQLLDEHLPVANPDSNKNPGKSVGSTVVSLLGFILPAAAMIGAITFVAVKHPFKNKLVNKPHQHHILRKQGDNALIDPTRVSADSVLSATAPTTDIQTASTNKGPGQLASINVASGSSVPNQNLVSAATINSTKTASYYQPNQQATAETSPAYSVLEYSPQPASMFPVTIPDVAQNGEQLKPALFSINQINLLAMTGQTPQDRNSAVTDKSDHDGIAVTDAGGQSGSGRNKKAPKIKTRAYRYKAPLLLGDSSRFGVGLLAGLEWPGSSGNFFAGLTLNYQLQDKWRLSTGITLHMNQHITSTYSHASFAPRDTGVTFQIRDERKAQQVISVPLTLEYAISKLISINAGPQISIASQPKRVVKASAGRSAYILNVPNRMDTVNRGHSIDTALNLTTLNKFNIGLSGGVSVHLNRHLHIEARYQQNLTPYNFNNSYLGNSKVYFHSVQIGLRYQFGN